MGGIGSIAFSYWAPRFFISSSKLKVTALARLQVSRHEKPVALRAFSRYSSVRSCNLPAL